MAPNVVSMANVAAQSAKGMMKMALLSRRSSVSACPDPDVPLVVMGNGPSLATAIAEDADILKRYPTMAVNFAANAPEFRVLKPKYYILADPHFFVNADDANVRRLMHNLADIDWPMRLFVPHKFAKSLPTEVLTSPHVQVECFNAVGIEGCGALRRFAYSRGLGMPRPRNVLIPAVMVGMLMGYRTIYVAGADHSWTQTLSVNERNEVVSVQPHFYKEDDREVKRITTDYLKYPLHRILDSFAVAFKSYFDIRNYADSRGMMIYNATPGSFIDAFERRPLSALR